MVKPGRRLVLGKKPARNWRWWLENREVAGVGGWVGEPARDWRLWGIQGKVAEARDRARRLQRVWR